MINIIVLNLTTVENDSSTKAFAEVLVADSIRINGLKLIENRDGDGYFIGMPSRKRTVKDTEIFEDVVEIMNHNLKHALVKAIVETYNAQKPVTVPPASHE